MENADQAKKMDATSPEVVVSPEAAENVKTLSLGINEFAVNLYQKIIEKEAGNVFFSPFSIALALGLVERGADGGTRDQIRRLFGQAVANRTDLTELFGSLQHQVLQIPANSGELRISNGLFYDEHFSMSMKQDYAESIEKWFKTRLMKAPFQKNLEASCAQINRWVSDATAGKIPNLFGSLRTDTVCVLANAIYLKMDWATRFDEKESRKRTFYRNGTDETQVFFMIRSDKGMQYNRNDDLQLIELPYVGRSMSMYIVLPNERNGVGKIERLKVGELMELFRTTHAFPFTIHLTIPRFTMRLKLELKDILEKLGVKDWKNMARMTVCPLIITRAVHEAYIKVDEKGTEAAAATAVEGAWVTLIPELNFIADHSFVYAIVHKPTLTIVFMGKVNSVEE